MLELNGEYWEEVEGGVELDPRHRMRLWTALKGLGMKRTKEGAFKQLTDAGIYEQFMNQFKKGGE